MTYIIKYITQNTELIFYFSMRHKHTKLFVHLIQYCTHVPVPGMTEVMTKDVRI